MFAEWARTVSRMGSKGAEWARAEWARMLAEWAREPIQREYVAECRRMGSKVAEWARSRMGSDRQKGPFLGPKIQIKGPKNEIEGPFWDFSSWLVQKCLRRMGSDVRRMGSEVQ